MAQPLFTPSAQFKQSAELSVGAIRGTLIAPTLGIAMASIAIAQENLNRMLAEVTALVQVKYKVERPKKGGAK